MVRIFRNFDNCRNQSQSRILNENIFSDNEFNFEIFSTNEPFDVNFEILEETYWNAGQKLSDCIVDIRCNVLSKLNDKRTVVVEFGQAYWLDKRHGFTPNVTASHTFSGEIFQSAGIH